MNPQSMSHQDALTKIAVFKGKQIRKVIHNNEWWFSVADIYGVLTDSLDANAYWRKLKQRLIKESSQVVTNCHGLKLLAPDGKMRETDCANTESIFRIIQSIPSPKAEPFKRWLAKVGFERVQEIENPELAAQRMRTLYKLKGYGAQAGGDIAGGARKQLEKKLGRPIVSKKNYLPKFKNNKPQIDVEGIELKGITKGKILMLD